MKREVCTLVCVAVFAMLFVLTFMERHHVLATLLARFK